MLLALAGEKSLLSGNLSFDSKPRSELNFQDLARFRAVMLQRDEALDILQVNDVLELCSSNGLPEFANSFASLLVPPDLRAIQIGNLSVGQRAKVFLAGAVLQNSKVLLLDEPTASLDDATTHDLVNFLKEFVVNGNSVIMASHDDRILKIATKTFLISEGSVVKIK